MRSKAGRAASGKNFAASAILILLAAQLLAVAHFHRNYNDRSFSQAQAVAVADVCGLCDFALHAPVTPAAPLIINHPLHQRISLELTDGAFTPAGAHPFFLTRAPPRTIA